MNILFLFHCEINPNSGGVQRVTDILAHEFKQRGHNVVFLSTSSAFTDFTEFSGIQEFATEFKNNQKLFLKHYLSILNKHNIDIVINQETSEETLYLLKNTPKEIKKISVWHTNPFGYVKYFKEIKKNIHTTNKSKQILKHISLTFPHIFKHRLKQKTIKRLYLAGIYSDKLCFLSYRFVDIVHKYIPQLPLDKLTAINNPNTFNNFKDSTYNKNNSILFVGRLSEVPKNIHEFIELWELLSRNNPKWNAYIVGDGPDRAYLENFARQRGITNLHFEGMKSNVSEYYAKANFICLTSISEGWPMILAEGMAYKCIPCVYGTFESAYDIIDNNECGFITTPFKPQEMADKIQSLIDNEEKRLQFARKAKEKIAYFTPLKIANQWEQLFYQLTNESIQ